MWHKVGGGKCWLEKFTPGGLRKRGGHRTSYRGGRGDGEDAGRDLSLAISELGKVVKRLAMKKIRQWEGGGRGMVN